MIAQDYYRILGISPEASWTEIRRRYRLLARRYHPDRNPDNPEAAAQFRRVTAAYEAIQGIKLKTQAKARPRPGAQNYRRPRFFHKESLLEEIFGIRGASHLMESPGADFRYDLQIPFAAAIRGMETDIRIPRTINCGRCRPTGDTFGQAQGCPDCEGRGRRFGGPGLLRFGPVCERCRGRGKISAQTCPQCHGQGFWVEARQYHLSIPPGTRDGARLRLAGEGGEGFRHGSPGNLEVVIHVQSHEMFRRVGNDIHCQVKVSFAQAALGGPIRVPTLDGFQMMDLPRGTQSGKIFRIPKAGAPGGIHHPPGDLVMEIVVTTPDSLNFRQVEILREIRQLGQEELSLGGL